MDRMKLDALDTELRKAIRAEPRILAALAYGSRTQRPGGVRHDDGYSDLEYYVYLHPGEHLNPSEIIGRVTTPVLAVINPYGTPNFVTAELHRIELHVAELDRLPDILDWPAASADPARMLVKDAGSALARLLARFAARPDWTPEEAQTTLDQVLNALVAARGLLFRGERLRAYEWFTSWGVIGGLVRLARQAEAAAQPRAAARRAEHDLSSEMLKRVGACAAGLEELEAGWVRALDLCTDLAQRLGLNERTRLQAALRMIMPVRPASGG
ncbi:hypothetical protein Q0M94_12510 [Deinococcus radiomollis]|uniref:hypothetical protein n=1 Tax=Deinococcus radiomollis TaxID=468916 RepID=UPI0038913532